ncbi:Threonine/homoserine efflux transporter RhtA [Catalinimonas alkaloidigena]|uniref:Threonine/homoserine efflux transporter RhtA n=1 Tax=Catalinimonas alkaloidigena TaxID=1075417 RepID=A0A1G9GAR4_9BACT|nr:DMT family transporter [Catalinimonas alkaloidigena]SDK97769.1 Threonine/homoserine efflux transporter RhtA [Catalinimonas alkaloidigena]
MPTSRTSTASHHRVGLLFALATAVTWGLTGVWVKLLPGVSLLGVVTGRLFVALLVMLPLWLWQRRQSFYPQHANLRLTWGLSLMMVFYYGLAVVAFQAAPVAEATLLINSSPLFAVAYQLLRGVPTSRNEKVGVTLAMIGVGVIVLPELAKANGGGQSRLIGDACALASAGVMAAYSILYRRGAERGEDPAPTAVATGTFAAGAPLLGMWLAQNPEEVARVSSQGHLLAALLTLGVISTVVPTFSYSAASRRLPVVLTTTTRLMTPVFAAIFALVVLGEVPSVWLVPGGFLVLGGLYLTTRRR